MIVCGAIDNGFDSLISTPWSRNALCLFRFRVFRTSSKRGVCVALKKQRKWFDFTLVHRWSRKILLYDDGKIFRFIVVKWAEWNEVLLHGENIFETENCHTTRSSIRKSAWIRIRRFKVRVLTGRQKWEYANAGELGRSVKPVLVAE
jgi:hypothetical protein